MTQPSVNDLLAFAHELADAAGETIRPYFRQTNSIDNKKVEDFDPVTVADREAETSMRRIIEARYPDHGILGEEHGAKPAGASGLTWVLDPIDGTRSFIGGFPTWGTLIAVNNGTEVLAGILDQPYTGERFVGSADGAFLGDQKLAVRACATLDDAVLYSTTPDMFKPGPEQDAFERVEATVKLRRFGGDCYAYAMLAMGFVDLVVESSMQAYDIQALIPIVEAAGGKVTDWQGNPVLDGGQILATGDARIHEQAMVLLSQ
jgi:histidinol phosphatase-like enzyme (inositol monophosphatase family)